MKACIFDLDGTLLNTLESLANCYNRVLASLGYPIHEVEAYRYFIGDGAHMCVERCLPPEARRPEIIDEALARQQADYRVSWHQDVTVYEGVEALLAALQTRHIPMAVLSNKDHEFTCQCVSTFFPEVSFSAIQGYGPDVPHKPDPTGARRLASQFKVDPASIAFLGDTRMDIQTANACGMISVGVLWGFRDAGELNEAGASRLIARPLDLLN
ncbi:MAG: HAD family hydrolase [Pseudomonadales bacterium]|nr:HAD family hydrolase [Pseudomonadales bacterium]